jgi:RNA polymerase sigma-70 factor (ECF subfamily)
VIFHPLPPGPARVDEDVARTDPELLRGVAEGNLTYLGDLYDRHALGVWRTVRRTLGDAADVEDVVHATFLGLPRIAASYDGRLHCDDWLKGIAVRIAMRRDRGVGRFRRMVSSLASVTSRWSSSDPERSAIHREDVAILEHAVAMLSLKKRAVFVLVELEGLTSEAAANALSIPAATVRSRLFHARRQLHTALADGHWTKN